MQIRDWFHPPRHVLTIFLAVVLVSGATLALLAWLLIQQDKKAPSASTAGAAEDQRRNGFPASRPVDTDSPVRQPLFFGHSLTEKSRRFRQQIAMAVFGHFLRCSSGHVMVPPRGPREWVL